MANGYEPSGAALIIVTGLSVVAVVGLYANDAIPRRSGPVPSSALSWPSWQSQSSYDDRSFAAPPPQPVQGQVAPSATYQRLPDQGGANPPPQQPYPQQQGYPPQGYPQQLPYPPPQSAPQVNDPRDVPDENGPPTQQQYQQPQGVPRY